jgi:hypothetical protein
LKYKWQFTAVRSLTDCLKAVNMKHIVYWAAQAWEKVSDSTLHKSWKNCKKTEGISTADEETDESYDDLHEMLENIPGCEGMQEEEVKLWITSDDAEQELTDQDMISAVLKSDDTDGADMNDTDESILDDNWVTADEGFKPLELRSSQFICNSVQFKFHHV